MGFECVDRSGPSHNLTTVRDAARDDVFLPSLYLNALLVDDQRVATLHNHHVFVVIVDMFSRGRSLSGEALPIDTIHPCWLCNASRARSARRLILTPWLESRRSI